MTQDPPTVPKSTAQRGSASAASWVLLLFIVVTSLTTGWVLGRGGVIGESRSVQAGLPTMSDGVDGPGGPAVGTAGTKGGDASIDPALPDPEGTEPDGDDRDRMAAAGATGEFDRAGAAGVSIQEIGRLKAEILHLRVLFRRLADAAQLDDGEFDLDFSIDAETGDGEPLSALQPGSPDAMALLIERFDPMLSQSGPLASIFDERYRAWRQRLSGHPLPNGVLSSGFGWRPDPVSGRSVMHRGADFVAPRGSEVLAIADGVVTWSGPNGGYGLLVEIEHVDGFRTRYAHNQTTIAPLGARVRKGDPIATLGSSGRSTGPHLHLEVRRRGQALDPGRYVR